MTRPSAYRSTSLIACALLFAGACDHVQPSTLPALGETGVAFLSLTGAPADAACLRITVKGATVAIRSFALMPNQTVSLMLSGLPLGQVVFTGEAFGVACSSVASETVATWISDAVPTTLIEGQAAMVALALHRAGSANIAVSFPDGGAGMCDGTPGQWDGCRGTGCFVCAEKLTQFPRYFQNHPSCVKNDTCAGQFFTCNASCPAPTDADRDPAMCDGTPGQWDGCRGTGCFVCAEKLTQFPRYFQNHPACVKNDTCAGQFFTCNASCPAPTDADRDPAMCDGTPGQWDGCRGTGCFVCAEKLTQFPRYFQNHPACVKNDTCAGQFFTCNASCPAPTDADRDPAMCDGTPGQWNGCRGTGCFVCAEKLTEFPRYFQNHPACVKNDTCTGQFFTCNASCPAPTDADRDPTVVRQFFEAESGMLTAPLATVADMSASGGKFIWSATTDSTTTVPAAGHALFSFNLATAKVVKVWGRFFVGPLGANDDSLWVRVDTGAWIQWNDIFPRIGNAGWAWDNVHDTVMGNSQPTFSLGAGNHTLDVAYRESGLKIDRFLITSDLVNKPL